MTSLYFASKKLSALGLRFHVTGAVFLRLLALAGLGHCPAPRWWRIIPLVAPWRLSGYQVLDFITRKGLVFPADPGTALPNPSSSFSGFWLPHHRPHQSGGALPRQWSGKLLSETVFDWETG